MPLRYDLKPVHHLTTGTTGEPGKRVFYLQAGDGEETITVIIEKAQLLSLEKGASQFLVDLEERYPDIPPASERYDEDAMALLMPLDPLFRVGNLGLGYDEEEDLIVLLAREIGPEEVDPEEIQMIRIWCSRSQLKVLVHYGLIVASQGRPICPHCGEPIDPSGHFCPKRNGHKH